MLKTMTFALLHFTVAFSVTYLLTGDLLVGGLVATIEPAINTIAYFFMRKPGAVSHCVRNSIINCKLERIHTSCIIPSNKVH